MDPWYPCAMPFVGTISRLHPFLCAPEAMFSNQTWSHGIANLLMNLGLGHPWIIYMQTCKNNTCSKPITIIHGSVYLPWITQPLFFLMAANLHSRPYVSSMLLHDWEATEFSGPEALTFFFTSFISSAVTSGQLLPVDGKQPRWPAPNASFIITNSLAVPLGFFQTWEFSRHRQVPTVLHEVTGVHVQAQVLSVAYEVAPWFFVREYPPDLLPQEVCTF